MSYKNIIALTIFVASFSLHAEIIDKKSLLISSGLGDISIYHDNNGFNVKSPSGSYEVQRCFMDKELRGISKNHLAALLTAGSYLSINKMNDSNDYSLKLNGRLKGGGAGGTTVGMYAGRLGTYAVAYGTIGLISWFAGPVAGPVVGQTLISTFGPAIELTSHAMSIGCGILGGVLTGPV